jgi:hypothetical protein
MTPVDLSEVAGHCRVALVVGTLALMASLPALGGARQRGTGGVGSSGSGSGTAYAQGTWTQVKNLMPEGAETALLLTDGTVFIKSFDSYQHNFLLTPTSTGDYVDGTFKRLADAPIGLIYGPCNVLKDGRVFIAGGEYLSNSSDHNTCAVYNPVTNTWTQGPDGLYGDIGDTGNEMLNNGTILVSQRFGPQTQIFNPVTMTWSAAASMPNPLFQSGDEESWQTLGDGSILNVMFNAARYLPSSNSWVMTGPMPSNLVDAATEIGPAVMLYNGTVLALGGTNNTALYTPPATLNGTGSWVAGPPIPGGNSSPDCPASVEPNGKVLFINTPTDFAAPSFAEYDPVANTMNPITGPPNTYNVPSFMPRFLDLPNGQILMTGWGPGLWVYTPVGGPQAGWKAHLNSCTKVNATTYTLTGTQLNGITCGGSYGDDASMNTNYPIVIMTNASTHAQFFAKSFNFSTMGLNTGNTVVSCQFSPPANLPAGNYSISTVASGVPSSNSVSLNSPQLPSAVQIYNSQGNNAIGTVTNLDAIDGQYYSVQSVPSSVGAVAAAQITYQYGSSNNVGGLADHIVVNAPKGCTNYIYFLNTTTNQFDLVSTTNMTGTDTLIVGGPTNFAPYINANGQVVVVDRAVYPVRFSSFQFQVKLDFAVMNAAS